MSSIHVFVNFDGEWDDCNIYSGYSVLGLILQNDCSYDGLIGLLAKALEKHAETHNFIVQYQAMQNGPRIRISDDSSLAFYLGLTMDEADKRSYPLCVDDCPSIAMDIEFLGIVIQPVRNFKNSREYHYQTLKANVDLLKLIRLGFTISEEKGNLLTCGSDKYCTWKFYFWEFNPNEDVFAALISRRISSFIII